MFTTKKTLATPLQTLMEYQAEELLINSQSPFYFLVFQGNRYYLTLIPRLTFLLSKLLLNLFPNKQTLVTPLQSLMEYQAEEIKIRPFADFAIIHARTRFKNEDGKVRRGRTTHVWVKRDGRWIVAAAHETR